MDTLSIGPDTFESYGSLRPLLPLSRYLGIWPCSDRHRFTWKQIFASFLLFLSTKLTLFYLRWREGFDNIADQLTALCGIVLPSLVHLIHLSTISVKISEFRHLIPNVLKSAAPYKLRYPKRYTLLIFFAVPANEMYGIWISGESYNAYNVFRMILVTHVQLSPMFVTIIFGTIIEYFSKEFRKMSQSMRANWSSVIPCTKDFHSAIRTVKELVPLFDVQILAIVVVMLIQIVLSLFKLVARAIKDSSDIHSMIFTTTRAVIDWSSMCLLCNACEVFNEEVIGR